jgi:hypothetical protein
MVRNDPDVVKMSDILREFVHPYSLPSQRIGKGTKGKM